MTQRGAALVTGLLLLSLITLLGLAGASSARVELQLAHNEWFRENAVSAASAGIEMAIRHVTVSAPENISTRLQASLGNEAGDVDVEIRFLGYESGLPQLPGGQVVAAHFEILSSGRAQRGAVDRQRSRILRTLEIAGSAASGTDCEPVAPGVRCVASGLLRRMSWQRLVTP